MVTEIFEFFGVCLVPTEMYFVVEKIIQTLHP